ncbi:MAG: tyrosine-type recombinase/integrase [Halodesulfurarchaeum sp.]
MNPLNQPGAWLDTEQVESLREAARSERTLPYLRDRNAAIVTLLSDTGLLVDEVVRLDVEHLDLEAGTLTLPPHVQSDSVAGGPERTTLELGATTATSDTVSVLSGYLEGRWRDTRALFPSREADRLSRKSVWRLIDTLAARALVRPHRADGGRGTPGDVTPLTLRHSVAFRLLREEPDCTVADVRRRLRLPKAGVERVYGHFARAVG